jgi:C_GCAxxG_C_C family probable redox protein
MVMNRAEKAVDLFLNQGYKCSQSVLEVFRDRYDISKETAYKISMPLAGGSGDNGMCGAVTGAYLVLGLEYGSSDVENKETFRDIIAKNRSISNKFREKNESTYCSKLTGVDVFSEEGSEIFTNENIKEEKCSLFVSECVQLLEEII